MKSSLSLYFILLALIRHNLRAATTPMLPMASLSADVARLNCLGFPADLLPSDRQLTTEDLTAARDAALSIMAERVGAPILTMINETTIDNPGSANRGLCDVNILLWLLPWPVCRVQSPPPRPVPVDAVREEVQRCY